ncbi:hypothetical protein SLA2020_399240 [Shorea laevis]
MEAKPQAAAAANRVYEDVDPPTKWAKDQQHDTLIVELPGFRIEQIKVQFVAGVLYIKHPKVITPAAGLRPEPAKSPVEAPRPQPKPKIDPAPAPAPPRLPAPAQASANTDAQKGPTKEKEGNDINKDSQKTPNADNAVSGQKTGEKQMSGGLLEKSSAGKEMAGTSEKQKSDHPGTSGNVDGGWKSDMQQEGYKQWVYSMATELKKRKKLMNLIVGALLLAVFVLYAKNAVKPTREPKK